MVSFKQFIEENENLSQGKVTTNDINSNIELPYYISNGTVRHRDRGQGTYESCSREDTIQLQYNLYMQFRICAKLTAPFESESCKINLCMIITITSFPGNRHVTSMFDRTIVNT